MSLTEQTIQKLKEKLIQEKARTEEELGRIGIKTTNQGDYETKFNEIGNDEDENASEVEEYTDNLALKTSLEKQLKEIIEALNKLEIGTYGKCENCGANIEIERLLAYPSAKTCTKC